MMNQNQQRFYTKEAFELVFKKQNMDEKGITNY